MDHFLSITSLIKHHLIKSTFFYQLSVKIRSAIKRLKTILEFFNSSTFKPSSYLLKTVCLLDIRGKTVLCNFAKGVKYFNLRSLWKKYWLIFNIFFVFLTKSMPCIFSLLEGTGKRIYIMKLGKIAIKTVKSS